MGIFLLGIGWNKIELDSQIACMQDKNTALS